MDREEIRDKISSIVWNINSNYSPSGAEATIMGIIEKVQEDAYQEGFKAVFDKTVNEYKRADNAKRIE